MIIFQIIVVFVAVIFLLLVLRGRQTYAARAWKKIGLCLLVLAMIVTVLFPATIDDLAHLLGVGRGADLLLYMVAVTFVGYALNNYLHQQRQNDTIYRLARKIALIEANDNHFNNKRQ